MAAYTTTQSGNDFTNVIKPVSIDPPVEKKITGDGAPEETFTFVLTAQEGAPLPEGSAENAKTVEVQGAGSVEFGEITYTAPGVYIYTLEEVPGKAEGYAYDTTEWTLTVAVTVDKDKGLAAETKMTAEGRDTAETAVFENVFATPTAKPTPAPTATVKPNEFYFSFTKEWRGEVAEDVTFTLYNANGTVKHHRLNRTKISDSKWRYEAWLSAAGDYYAVEDKVPGYTTVYQNIGEHADETDRVYNGGTVINSKVPKTGDGFSPTLWWGLALVSLAVIGGLAAADNKRSKKQIKI